MLNYNNKKGTIYEKDAKTDFLNWCSGSKCDFATLKLLDGISFNSGLSPCNLLDTIYTGDANSTFFYKGVRDDVANKSAYLLNLAHMGVTAEVANVTLDGNSKTAWKLK